MLLTRVRFPSPAPENGLLAQLVRALPSHGRGRWSESSTAHHIFQEARFWACFFVWVGCCGGGGRGGGWCWLGEAVRGPNEGCFGEGFGVEAGDEVV